ncbi:MAG: hypothetical protein KDC87_08065, partial [Planctomycetes bacterium]|nr:hypothetical protein [Planctomycetota bacterium]
EFKDAVEGIEAVNKLFKRRAERAQEHYVLGSRARGELPPSPQRALYHSTLSTELDPSLARAKNLQQQAGMQIAQARFQAAKVMADKGFHSAALAACKRIKDHWPEFPGIGERIATLTKEVEARTMCSQAEMLLRKNEFDQADKLLGKAFDTAISGDVKAIVSGVMRSAKLRRYESEYLKAKDLQRDWKLEAALSEFQRIAKAFSGQKGGFMDVAERIGRIEKEISEATDAWKQGQAAEQKNDLKGAIGFYKEALAVYPGFRGLDRRVAELEAKTKE